MSDISSFIIINMTNTNNFYAPIAHKQRDRNLTKREIRHARRWLEKKNTPPSAFLAPFLSKNWQVRRRSKRSGKRYATLYN